MSDDKMQQRRLSENGMAAKLPARTPIITRERKRSGIYLESTEDEQLGVLPHQCTRVKEAMSRSVSVGTPLAEIGEAVRLMRTFDVSALLSCNGSTLIGTLCDRDVALANASSSEAIHRIMTPIRPTASKTTFLSMLMP
ncbi:MAG: hypothetical protein ABI988_10465 [Nitrospirota bacterium]